MCARPQLSKRMQDPPTWCSKMTKQDRNYRDLGDTTNYGPELLKPIKRGNTRRVPMFLLISGPQKGRPVSLPEGRWTLGRGPGSDYSIHGRGISRVHLVLKVAADGTVTATDSGSTNGMLVNAEKVSNHVFSPGDILQIGPDVALKFELIPSCELDLQLRLYDQSTVDSLTGLYNRAYLLNSLRQSLAFSHRHHSPLCLLLIDIDHFKRINDTHGHSVGDSILAQFGKILTDALRTEDECARIGGEEFALLLRGLEPDQALEAADRIRVIIANHSFQHEDFLLGCTVSIGAAMAPIDQHLEPSALLRMVDKNLYKAKHRGRNCTVFG